MTNNNDNNNNNNNNNNTETEETSKLVLRRRGTSQKVNVGGEQEGSNERPLSDDRVEFEEEPESTHGVSVNANDNFEFEEEDYEEDYEDEYQEDYQEDEGFDNYDLEYEAGDYGLGHEFMGDEITHSNEPDGDVVLGHSLETSQEENIEIYNFIGGNMSMLSYFGTNPPVRQAMRDGEGNVPLDYTVNILVTSAGDEPDNIYLSPSMEDAIKYLVALGYKYSYQYNIFVLSDEEGILRYARIFMDMDLRGVIARG